MRFSTPNVAPVVRGFVEAALRKAPVDNNAKNKNVMGKNAAVTTFVCRWNVKACSGMRCTQAGARVLAGVMRKVHPRARAGQLL